MNALYDVVIYAFADRTVQSIVGRDLEMSTGYYNAEKRMETALNRINLDSYSAEIVPAGSLKAGDIVPFELGGDGGPQS